MYVNYPINPVRRCDKGDHWENILLYGGCWGSCGQWDENYTKYWLNKNMEQFKDEAGKEAARIESLSDNQGEIKGDPNCAICEGKGRMYKANRPDDYDTSDCICVTINN